MLKPVMETAINKQINAELWSAYLYLSMSYDMTNKGFDGMANWFFKQAKEEFEHAQKFMEYLVAYDLKVKLMPIEEVRQSWNSPIDAFEDTLLHEKKVTEFIQDLMEKAIELKDYATINFLNFFIEEQVEEEATARQHLGTLKLIESDTAAMYLFDQSLKQR